MGESSLPTRHEPGACVFATHSSAASPTFHQRYAGTESILLREQSSIVDVNVVRYSGLPALVGDHLVSLLPRVGQVSAPDVFVSEANQRIPHSGYAELHPDALLRVASPPMLRVPFDAVPSLAPTPSPATATPTPSATPPSTHENMPRTFHVKCTPLRVSRLLHTRPNQDISAVTSRDTPVPPKPVPTELLDRVNAAQRQVFDRLWSRFPAHLHDSAFGLHDLGGLL